LFVDKSTNIFVNEPIYIDCNATTPLEPCVREVMRPFWEEEFGNAGSRTHEYGARAKQAVQWARDQVAAVVDCRREEVIFTSGATESNNLALLGLAAAGLRNNRRHIISTQIEHKAVLEPLEELAKRGFEIELIPPNGSGYVEAERIANALRTDTLLVSVMHANNETGVIQPIDDIAAAMAGHPAWLHVDAAQTFGKVITSLRNPRIELISVSAHKIYGPKGVGTLIVRRRGYEKPPLQPLLFGGGQERGLRPGTLPVPLVIGFGEAARVALSDHATRAQKCAEFREHLASAFKPLDPEFNGDPSRTLSHVINVSFPGIDSEALMLALKGVAAISNGSACTSSSYTPSHVLMAMGFSKKRIQAATRWSWCHLTPKPDLEEIAGVIRRFGHS
jgi:cysteine desulfurase